MLQEFKSDKIFNLFNINFLKKEKMYTKLKYSRTPQYDIVSGGAAALLAGFLGFLITEKFGFELVDSADFYFLFMYLVFLFKRLPILGLVKLLTQNIIVWNYWSTLRKLLSILLTNALQKYVSLNVVDLTLTRSEYCIRFNLF